MLVKIANMEDPYQIESDLGLHCLSRPYFADNQCLKFKNTYHTCYTVLLIYRPVGSNYRLGGAHITDWGGTHKFFNFFLINFFFFWGGGHGPPPPIPTAMLL